MSKRIRANHRIKRELRSSKRAHAELTPRRVLADRVKKHIYDLEDQIPSQQMIEETTLQLFRDILQELKK